MNSREIHLVTGAFGYSGRHMAAQLLEQGHEVRTLTGHPDRPDPFGGRVAVFPLRFDDPDALRRALDGVMVLYNTYWIRFERGKSDHSLAVANTRRLFDAAGAAGVERVVHVSITNPSMDSPLPYFRGKAELEAALAESGLSHAILRPAVLFGDRDVLINNIAWMLRRLPLFGIPGDGTYGVQPIHVEDQARLAVELGASRQDVTVDAVGPETYRYEELVRLVARNVAPGRRMVHLPPWVVLVVAKGLGRWLGDVVLTADEIDGLMAGLLVSANEPTGTVRLSEWLDSHGERLGRVYANEVSRHYLPQAVESPRPLGQRQS